MAGLGVLAGIAVLAAGGVLLTRQGLERADQLASVLGLALNLVATSSAVVALHFTVRQARGPAAEPAARRGRRWRLLGGTAVLLLVAATGSALVVREWTDESPAREPVTARPLDPIADLQDDRVRFVAFGADSAVLVTGHREHLRLWDVAGRGRIGDRLGEHVTGADSFAVSPDGTRIAVATSSGWRKTEIWLYDATRRSLAGSWPGVHLSTIAAMAFSPDSRSLATVGTDRTARLWDLGGARPAGRSLPLAAEGSAVAFSPDGATLAVGAEDGQISLFDARTGLLLGLPLAGHRGEVAALAFAGGGMLVSAGVDRTARRWRVTGRQAVGPAMTGHTRNIDAAAISPDGTVLATASSDGTVRLWDVVEGRPIGAPLPARGATADVAFSPDGKLLAAGGAGPTVQLWAISPPLVRRG